MAQLQGSSLIDCLYIPDFIASGTVMAFNNTNAPTSWTKITTFNDATLRLVSGSVSNGGSSAFSTVLSSSRTISGATVQAAANKGTGPNPAGIPALPSIPVTVTFGATLADIADHQHPHLPNSTVVRRIGTQARAIGPITAQVGGSTGASAQHPHTVNVTLHPHNIGSDHNHPSTETQHAHPFSTTQPFAVNYTDVIFASKD
jgi:hypothetical protein